MADALRPLSLLCMRRVLAALLMALVLVQTVGVMHRVAHAQQSTGVSVHVASDTSGVLTFLWGEHSNSAECQMFDQSCPDLWHAPALVLLPVLPAVHWVIAVLREHFAQDERFYAARGPPRLALM